MNSNLVIEISQEVVTQTKPKVNLHAKYKEVEETQEIIVDDRGERFEFTDQFTYLGSTLTFLLDNTINIRCRITKALKVMGALRTI